MGDSMDVDAGGIMEVDMGEETINLRDEQAPPRNGGGGQRRRSMSHEEQQHRRASIKAILADERLPIQERRKSIQNLMDGRRSSIGTASVASTTSADDSNPYGYGDDGDADYGDGNRTMSGDNRNGIDMSIMDSVEVCEPVSNEATKRAEQTRPPCNHYARNCSLVAPCCGATFGCRICHDDSPILPPLLIQRQAMRRYGRSSSMPMNPSMTPQTPEDTHHNIDRFAIKEVICRECFTKQSSKT
jgi:hypothetical protein